MPSAAGLAGTLQQHPFSLEAMGLADLFADLQGVQFRTGKAFANMTIPDQDYERYLCPSAS